MALPSLSTIEVREIEKMIIGWTTKLTWDLLIMRLKSELDITTTRQTLNTYTSIKAAFTNQKNKLRGKPSATLLKYTKQDFKMAERIERLEAENASLERDKQKLRAFIAEIADTAKHNPAVMNVMNTVKQRVSRMTNIKN